MTNVTLTGLPPGNATLHHAAQVEPQRQGSVPLPAPLATVAADADGQATFDLTERIEYVVFDVLGRAHNVLLSATRGGTP